MSGTKAGGLKARAKNLERNPNFYKEIGAKGGKKCGYKGFATNIELARKAGAKGGRISKRTAIDDKPLVIDIDDSDDI